MAPSNPKRIADFLKSGVSGLLMYLYRESNIFTPHVPGILSILSETNMAINDWGFIDSSDRILGGAVGTIAWVRDLQLTIFHVGDTTGMLLRQDQPPQLLTSLHEIDGGISRYYGMGRKLEIEVRSEQLEYGDLILLVSDGVIKAFTTIEAANLVQHVYHQTGDVGVAAKELATRSRSRRSSDDITVMVIDVEE